MGPKPQLPNTVSDAFSFSATFPLPEHYCFPSSLPIILLSGLLAIQAKAFLLPHRPPLYREADLNTSHSGPWTTESCMGINGAKLKKVLILI